MKNPVKLFLLPVMSLALAAMAQSTPPAQSSGSTQQAPAQPPATIASVVDREVSILERELVSAAEAMPDEKFNFAPNSLNIQGSDYKGVRTFAQQVKHIAATNFMLWAPVLGEKPALDINKGDGPASMTSKADIVQYLKDSYALGHRAAKSLTAENVVEGVSNPFGAGTIARLFCATFAVSHGFDHYGQIVEYLRMNGIVPPASRGNN